MSEDEVNREECGRREEMKRVGKLAICGKRYFTVSC